MCTTFEARLPGFAKQQKFRKDCSTAQNWPGKTLSKHVAEFCTARSEAFPCNGRLVREADTRSTAHLSNRLGSEGQSLPLQTRQPRRHPPSTPNPIAAPHLSIQLPTGNMLCPYSNLYVPTAISVPDTFFASLLISSRRSRGKLGEDTANSSPTETFGRSLTLSRKRFEILNHCFFWTAELRGDRMNGWDS